MRTTIELSEHHRAMLLRLAAEMGEKGFSRFVAEALDAYLSGLGPGDERVSARRLKGVLSPGEAADLKGRTTALREHWR